MKAKKSRENNLSDWEWTLTWSSLRYFCGRYSIASAMYPSDLIKNFGKRLDPYQKKSLSEEIVRQMEWALNHSDEMWLKHDMEAWSALKNYLDVSEWRELYCEGEEIEPTTVIAFPYERKEGEDIVKRWVPVDSYEKNGGSTRTTVHEPYIKQIKEYGLK
jgi:hypothetical protein